MKEKIIEIIIKVILYALTLIAGALGFYSLSSCRVSRSVEHNGKGYFQYYDTISTNGNYILFYDKTVR